MVDTPGSRRRPIDFRDPRLVTALLAVLYEAEDDVDPHDLTDLFASDLWKPDTISRTISDLVGLGAIRRVTPLRNRRERSKLRMTGLGRAWMDRRLEHFVGEEPPDPEAPDPVDEPSTS